MSGSTELPPEDPANQNYFNAAVRHAVDIRRYTAGQVEQILRILELADRELVHQLRALLTRQVREPGRAPFTVQRIRTMLVEIAAAREAVYQRLDEFASGNLTDMAKIESRHEEDMIQLAIPIELTLASVSIKQIGSIVTSSPFEGRLLKEWFDSLAELEQQRVQDAITIGLTAGETNEQIITRIIGTKAANYQDGILSISRRNAEAIVRTAANHVANQARAQVWDLNRDIVSEERWTSVLDGRTTPICQARDGMVFPIGVGPRPPAHFNCRSIMVAVLDGLGIIGDRPFVRSNDRRQARDVNFRDEAKAQAGDEIWSSMSAAEKRAAVSDRRTAWAKENIGQVPAATTYQEWLTKQPAAFQDKVLGPTRGLLFRQGGLTVQQFVDRFGTSITLDELKSLYPAAWARAME